MERGKKTNKDRLFEQVEKRARGEAQGVDASHLAQSLGIPRNLASSLLNELAAEGRSGRKRRGRCCFIVTAGRKIRRRKIHSVSL